MLRTAVCAILGSTVAAEYFATANDAYILLGKVAENDMECDTADGRPATREFAYSRLARMLGGDAETVSLDDAASLAEEVMGKQIRLLEYGITLAIGHLATLTQFDRPKLPICFVISGSGEFLASELFTRDFKCQVNLSDNSWEMVSLDNVRSLSDQLGPTVSVCAPAYAVAVLAAEARA